MHILQTIIQEEELRTKSKSEESTPSKMPSTTNDDVDQTTPTPMNGEEESNRNDNDDTPPNNNSLNTTTTTNEIEHKVASTTVSTKEEISSSDTSNPKTTDDTTTTNNNNTDELAITSAANAADESYTPPQSTLSSTSVHPLIQSVDGPSLKHYNSSPHVYSAKLVPIPLRGKLNVPIHVSVSGSIVEYKLDCMDFDIGFGIVAEREDAVNVVLKNTRTNAHLSSITGKFLVGTVPCALIFTFDNEYSWFREKKISYRITVTPPSKERILTSRKIRATTALKVITLEKTKAEQRLEQACAQKGDLSHDIQTLEHTLAEKKKTYNVLEKEEQLASLKFKLRSTQEMLLKKRLEEGWEDAQSEENDDGEEKTVYEV